MNRNIEKAQFDLGKVNALMRAIEETYLDIEAVEEETEKMSQFELAFYALWDIIKLVEKDLNDAQRECLQKSRGSYRSSEKNGLAK